jgi:hypothetical protein
MSDRITSRGITCHLGELMRKLALLPSMAFRVHAMLRRAPNPAVERTVNGEPRRLASSNSAAPLSAAHLQR